MFSGVGVSWGRRNGEEICAVTEKFAIVIFTMTLIA